MKGKVAVASTLFPLLIAQLLAAQEMPLKKAALSGLALRSVGPALTSGRIADLAVDPSDPATYYVATASGGVWKTVNGGTTFDPIFDKQGSYSTGVVELDPSNPHIVWVGTGENNGQRALGYGDGVYKSVDGGGSWKRVGLESSEHIGKILIHPEDGDVVYVAAQGPNWSSGGDRGLYRTTDGGDNWSKILDISEHTGVNEVHMDPRDPDVLYATAWQRRRHVWTWISGGPESALYKSTDAGETWDEVTQGLPEGDVGRIGVCISPADPDYVYAMVEAGGDRGGFFRSTDRGGSFEKMNDYHTSGNYYVEVFCDRFDRDRVVSMDVWNKVTNDGGETWVRFGEQSKHVDNHALWQDPEDPDHYLNGNDGGIYETWDGAKTWQFKPNLPITQFYRVGLDLDTPFYNIYGGTQDNFSLGGPSRTISRHGIVNSDWYVTNGGDGFFSAIDPTNPDIVYAESQYGGLVRFDRASGEIVNIQPGANPGEPALRWNWDAPLLISPHDPTRLYHAANRVLRSDDRGDHWELVSPDLTAQYDRNQWPVMDRFWGMDAVAKNTSTTIYGTIVAMDESPLREGLLFVGTDDGLIQRTDNGGTTWQRTGAFPEVPERTFVSVVRTSRHNENIVYAAFNNHKNGDFKPYLLKSDDRGQSWRSIAADLPERGSVWAVVEDPEVPELLFAGTEFGLYFSRDGGAQWREVDEGLPPIPVRDIAIQARERDLVIATFGRGFWVLDDYTPLRSPLEEVLTREAHIFPIRDALIFVPSRRLGLDGKSFQGESYFSAENPPFGALISYWLKDKVETRKERRQAREKELAESASVIPYPSFEEMRAEDQEEEPYLLFTIRDSSGAVVRRIKREATSGLHRFAWDLRYPPLNPVSLESSGPENPFRFKDVGPWVMPGNYSVSLSRVIDGMPEPLLDPVSFEVVPLNNATLTTTDKAALLAFQQDAGRTKKELDAAGRRLDEASDRLRHITPTIRVTTEMPESSLATARELERRIAAAKILLSGDRSVARRQFETPTSLKGRISNAVYSSFSSTQGPSVSQRAQLRYAREGFQALKPEIDAILADLAVLESELDRAGAPYTPARRDSGS
ncbi:MAG: glycosyl hydrolase [Pseudomonadota bacterium]